MEDQQGEMPFPQNQEDPGEPKEQGEATPLKLWDPVTAANGAVLFTPIFGAWIHAKNWETLQRPAQALKCMVWVYITVAFIILGTVFLPGAGLWGLMFLVIWYLANGRKQIKYFKEHQIKYEKKSWTVPLLIGIVGVAAWITIILTVIGPFHLQRMLETQAADLVNQMIKQQFEIHHIKNKRPVCQKVVITEEVAHHTYLATAYFDNGEQLQIRIELRDDKIWVKVVKQLK